MCLIVLALLKGLFGPIKPWMWLLFWDTSIVIQVFWFITTHPFILPVQVVDNFLTQMSLFFKPIFASHTGSILKKYSPKNI